MKINIQRCLAIAAICAMGFANTGCGRTDVSGGSDASGALNYPSTEALDADLDAMQESLAKTNTEVSKITQSSLQDDVRQFFNEFLGKVDAVEAQLNELRVKITARLNALNPVDQADQELKERLLELQAKLDEIEAQKDLALANLVQTIDKKLVDIDGAVAKMDPNDPLTWIAKAYWLDLRETIVKFRNKIADKI